MQVAHAVARGRARAIERGHEGRDVDAGVGGRHGRRQRARPRIGRLRCEHELVGRGVNLGQQVPRHGWRQLVEGSPELRVVPGQVNGFHAINAPTLLRQAARERLACVEVQVRAVEKTFGAGRPLAMHQRSGHAGIGHVGYGNQQPPAALQQVPAGAQDQLGLAQVLQHIGADDEVIALPGKAFRPGCVLQVQPFKPLVPAAGGGLLDGAQGHAVDAAVQCCLQMPTELAAARAQVQHACAG